MNLYCMKFSKLSSKKTLSPKYVILPRKKNYYTKVSPDNLQEYSPRICEPSTVVSAGTGIDL